MRLGGDQEQSHVYIQVCRSVLDLAFLQLFFVGLLLVIPHRALILNWTIVFRA